MPTPSPREIGALAGRRPWILGSMVLCIGHVVLIVGRTYRTGGDWAFIEMRTRDVFSGDSPLTGAWSRYGWNHPGPVLYHLLAVPYWLTGSSWRGLWIGAMLINVAALVAAVRLHEPRSVAGDVSEPLDVGAWSAAWAIAIAGVWSIAAGPVQLFTDPWNAAIVVLPVLTMVAAAGAVLLGDRRGVAVAAVVFVATAQTHAAYGVLLLPLVLVALVVGFVRWRRFTLLWCGIASLLMIPALVDTIVDWPGNFYRSIRFTLTADEPAVGMVQAVRVIGRATSLSFFTEPRLPSFVAVVRDPPWGVFPFAALFAAIAARRVAAGRGWDALRRLLEMTALLWLVGAVLMVSRTRGPLLIWLITWMVAAAALTWCLVAAVVLRSVLDRGTSRSDPMVLRGCIPVSRPSDPVTAGAAGIADPAGIADLRGMFEEGSSVTTARPFVATASALAFGAIALGLAVVNVTSSVGEGYPFQELVPVVSQFADDAAPLAEWPIAIDVAGDGYVAGAVQSGLVLELERRGFEARGRPDQRLQMGEHRTDVALAPPSLLVRVESRSGTPAGATAVSVWDPLTDTERAEADSLMDELTELLDAAGVGDRRDLLDNELAPIAAFEAPTSVEAELASFERLGELHARGPLVVLYLFEP